MYSKAATETYSWKFPICSMIFKIAVLENWYLFGNQKGAGKLVSVRRADIPFRIIGICSVSTQALLENKYNMLDEQKKTSPDKQIYLSVSTEKLLLENSEFVR